MPKIAINWETTSVSFYKFVCKDPTILYSYVGHTTNFSQRKWTHKSCCNNPNDKAHNIPLYLFIRANGGLENWSMIEIQSCFCKDKREAERIENELIEQQQLKLNARKSFVAETRKEYIAEWRVQHKEQIAIKTAQYYEQHKEILAIKQVKYCENNKEHIVTKKAEWYQKNKEQISIKRAEYYQNKKLTNMTK
jgi:hypothetical protein